MDGNLVLSRKVGEKIVIHQEGVVLAVIHLGDIVNGHKARIGIAAGQSIRIDREEVYNAKMRAKPVEQP